MVVSKVRGVNVKIGMIGIGDIAQKAYLPVLSQVPGIELHVCTRNEKVLEEVAAKYHLNHTYHSMDDWLASGMEAAFVHSSTDSHEMIVDQLLDHGIHVYIDKPISYHGEVSSRLVEKAKNKGLILMTGFNRRFAPPYQKLKELADPNMIVMQKNRGHQATDVRTFVFDDFIHVIDTLLYLFPYAIQDINIQGKKKDGKLHHVVIQLLAKEGIAIGIMNREAGTTEEKVEVMSVSETRTVMNVSDITTHKDKSVFNHGSDDWEPTLLKRGFHSVTTAFLEAVEKGSTAPENYDRDLQPHLIAEKIVRTIGE